MRVLRRALVLAVVLVAAGCGSSETEAEAPEPAPPAAAPVAPPEPDPDPHVTCVDAARDGADRLVVCPSGRQMARRVVRVTPSGERTVLVKPVGMVGHWRSVAVSPDGRTLLLQWSAECEVPVAYFAPAAGGKARPVHRRDVESVAQGWTLEGLARIRFPKDICGAGHERPGVSLVDPDNGAMQRVVQLAQP